MLHLKAQNTRYLRGLVHGDQNNGHNGNSSSIWLLSIDTQMFILSNSGISLQKKGPFSRDELSKYHAEPGQSWFRWVPYTCHWWAPRAISGKWLGTLSVGYQVYIISDRLGSGFYDNGSMANHIYMFLITYLKAQFGYLAVTDITVTRNISSWISWISRDSRDPKLSVYNR